MHYTVNLTPFPFWKKISFSPKQRIFLFEENRYFPTFQRNVTVIRMPRQNCYIFVFKRFQIEKRVMVQKGDEYVEQKRMQQVDKFSGILKCD